MFIEEQKILLKDGRTSFIKTPTAKDAEDLLNHIKITYNETTYMARYPEEVTTTVEDEENIIENQIRDERFISLCAVIDGKIVGHGAIGCIKKHIKYLHRGWFGISVKKEYWNFGIGTILLTNLLKNAKLAGFEQIELEVCCENKRAITLYEKLGFKVYGTRKNSFKYKDGSYSDDYLMALEL